MFESLVLPWAFVQPGLSCSSWDKLLSSADPVVLAGLWSEEWRNVGEEEMTHPAFLLSTLIINNRFGLGSSPRCLAYFSTPPLSPLCLFSLPCHHFLFKDWATPGSTNAFLIHGTEFRTCQPKRSLWCTKFLCVVYPHRDFQVWSARFPLGHQTNLKHYSLVLRRGTLILCLFRIAITIICFWAKSSVA